MIAITFSAYKEPWKLIICTFSFRVMYTHRYVSTYRGGASITYGQTYHSNAHLINKERKGSITTYIADGGYSNEVDSSRTLVRLLIKKCFFVVYF